MKQSTINILRNCLHPILALPIGYVLFDYWGVNTWNDTIIVTIVFASFWGAVFGLLWDYLWQWLLSAKVSYLDVLLTMGGFVSGGLILCFYPELNWITYIYFPISAVAISIEFFRLLNIKYKFFKK